MLKIWFILPVFLLFTGCMFYTPQKSLYKDSFVDEPRGLSNWTIMVYMNGDNSLSTYTTRNLNQMEAAYFDERIQIIVLMDQYGTGNSKLYKVVPDSSTTVTSSQRISGTINGVTFSKDNNTTEINMLDVNTLNDFIAFSKNNYPAKHYALLLWSHADGFRSSDSRGISDGSLANVITNKQIAESLQNKDIDILAFDACLEGSMEMIWSLKMRNAAKYLIASPDEIPGEGWAYTGFLNKLFASSMGSEDFIRAAVEAYRDQYSLYSNVSLVGYDLTKNTYAEMSTALNNFFSWVQVHQATEGPIFTSNSVKSFPNSVSVGTVTYYHRNFIDYINTTGYPAVSELAIFKQMALYGWKYENGTSLTYNGVSIIGAKGTFDSYFTTYYKSTDFSTDSALTLKWYDILYYWTGFTYY